jgi:hypothetical protein
MDAHVHGSAMAHTHAVRAERIPFQHILTSRAATAWLSKPSLK